MIIFREWKTFLVINTFCETILEIVFHLWSIRYVWWSWALLLGRDSDENHATTVLGVISYGMVGSRWDWLTLIFWWWLVQLTVRLQAIYIFNHDFFLTLSLKTIGSSLQYSLGERFCFGHYLRVLHGLLDFWGLKLACFSWIDNPVINLLSPCLDMKIHCDWDIRPIVGSKLCIHLFT